MGIGDYIRRRRKTIGLTQDELARKLGRASSTISQWETESEPVPMDMLKAISDALEEPSPVKLYDLAGVLADLPAAELVRMLDGATNSQLRLILDVARVLLKKQNN